MTIVRFVAAALLITAAAWGHAVLLQATPAAGSVFEGRIVPVSLRFNSRIDARRSRIAIVTKGKEQPLSSISQTAPNTISAEIKDVVPGPCRVRWQVLASDGHITRGEIMFQVK